MPPANLTACVANPNLQSTLPARHHSGVPPSNNGIFPKKQTVRGQTSSLRIMGPLACRWEKRQEWYVQRLETSSKKTDTSLSTISSPYRIIRKIARERNARSKQEGNNNDSIQGKKFNWRKKNTVGFQNGRKGLRTSVSQKLFDKADWNPTRKFGEGNFF